MRRASHTPIIQVVPAPLRPGASQPKSLQVPPPSFCRDPVFWSFLLPLPLPGFLIHSFPFITETHSCMGEKHLPAAASGDRGGGAWRESQLQRECRELGEAWKLRGTTSLGKGFKLQIPFRFHPISNLGACGLMGHLSPFVQSCSEAGFPPLCRGEASSHKRRITLALSSRGWSEGRGAGPCHLHR